MKANLKELQDKFFTEIKEIADRVNIEMPEPSEIDLIQDKIYDPKTILDEYCDKYGLNSQSNINSRRNHADTISNLFKDIKPVFNNTSGTVNYQSVMIDEMEQRGIVSEADGAKPRTVLITREEMDELFDE